MQNPLNLYKHLRQWLESRGVEELDHDECLFIDGEIVVLFWVDAYIIYAKNGEAIDTLIQVLKIIFFWNKRKTW